MVRLCFKVAVWVVVAGLPALPQGMATGDRKPQVKRPLPAGKVAPAVEFRDIASAAGVSAVNISASPAKKNYIVETTGNGVGLIDFDEDGLLDILLLNAGENLPAEPRAQVLYRNLGGLRFEDVTVKAGIPKLRWAQGVCAGDFDNDGHEDLLLTQWGPNVLLRNMGGRFVEESNRLPAGNGKRWSTGCAFLDYDRDGDLDLFVAHYLEFEPKSIAKPGDKNHCTWKSMEVVCGPRGLPGEAMALYRNDKGQFVDVSKEAGVTTAKNFYGFTVLTGDYDDDGWPDVYVACDSTASLFFRNLGNGKFEELGISSGAALNEDGREQAGMGATAADFNRDGRLDIFKTNFTDDTPSLYKNMGDFTFNDETVAAGLAVHTKYLGWGAAFVDVDHDGWKDIFYANGHVYPEVDAAGIGESYHQSRVLFWNRGDGQFFDLSSQAGSGITDKHASRGLALGDLDNDGTLEVVISNMHQAPSVLQNVLRPKGNALLLDVRTASGRAALGARLLVTTPSGKQVDEVRSGGFHISQGDFRLHFGLGTATEAKVAIRWPDGTREELGAVGANKIVKIVQGKGITGSLPFAKANAVVKP